MAYKITDDCISCGACEPECPNKAIKEGSTVYVIEPELCSECVGSHTKQQCVEICPVASVVPDPAHQESRDHLLAKWVKIHPGGTPKVT